MPIDDQLISISRVTSKQLISQERIAAGRNAGDSTVGCWEADLPIMQATDTKSKGIIESDS